MLEMLRYRLVLLLSVLVLWIAPVGIAEESSSRWLVSPELLEHAKLKILWDNKLPIKENESLEQLFIVGNRIYALSNHNYMVSLNREKGNVIFSRPVAKFGLPVVGLELYKDKLFSVIGGELVEISPEFGTEHNARRLGFGITCPVVRNSSYFYVAGTDRCVHALRADDKVEVFKIAAEKASMITSVVAGEDFVVFGTDAGNVRSIRPDSPSMQWSFDAADGIARPIVRDEGSLFFASKDTNVYRVEISTGKLGWEHPYQAGAVLDRAPRVSRHVVYQYAGNKGLAAIDKGTGKLIWQLPEGVDLLAEAEGKAYVITNAGTLVVMDNKKAKRLSSVNFARVSKYVTNVTDSKIYIADDAGRIACLEPIK